MSTRLSVIFQICIVILGATFIVSAAASQEEEVTTSESISFIHDVVGVEAADLDGNTVDELLLKGKNSWGVLSYDLQENTYNMVWESGDFPGRVYDFEAFYFPMLQQKVILVTASDGLHLYQAHPVKKIFTYPLPEYIGQITLADADNDGVDEIVISGRYKTYFYSVEDLSLEGSIEFGGKLAIGNVDDDTLIEMVYRHGPVITYDGDTAMVKWAPLNAIGSRVELADIDNDGRDELISGWFYSEITAYDVEHRSKKWWINTLEDIYGMDVSDTDGDGTYEVVYANENPQTINVLNGMYGYELYSFDSLGLLSSNIISADLDADGTLELIWTHRLGGPQSIENTRLVIYDIKAAVVEYYSPLIVDEGNRDTQM